MRNVFIARRVHFYIYVKDNFKYSRRMKKASATTQNRLKSCRIHDASSCALTPFEEAVDYSSGSWAGLSCYRALRMGEKNIWISSFTLCHLIQTIVAGIIYTMCCLVRHSSVALQTISVSNMSFCVIFCSWNSVASFIKKVLLANTLSCSVYSKYSTYDFTYNDHHCSKPPFLVL